MKSWKDLCPWSAIWVEIDSKKGKIFSHNIFSGAYRNFNTSNLLVLFVVTKNYATKAIWLKILTMKVLENLIDKFDSQNGIFFMNILWKRKCVKKNHNQIQHIVIQFDFVKTEEKGVFWKDSVANTDKVNFSWILTLFYPLLEFVWICSTYCVRYVTAKRILERLGIQTSSSFVKIW